MKSFQPKAESAPHDVRGSNDTPRLSVDSDDQLTQSEPETEHTHRSDHRNRNVDVNFKASGH